VIISAVGKTIKWLMSTVGHKRRCGLMDIKRLNGSFYSHST